MAERIERLVREVVQDLAAGADVISERDRRRLAVHATDRAHTLRHRRRGGIAALVALITALSLGLPYGLRYLASERHPVQPGTSTTLPPGVDPVPGVATHVIDHATAAVELVDGWYVLGNKMVLNLATRTYDPFRAATVIASPTGRWVATQSVGGYGYRVYNREGGASHLYPMQSQLTGNGHTSEPGWSPDGDTFVVTEWGSDGSMVVDGEWYEGPVLVVTRIHAPTQESSQNAIAVGDLTCAPCQVIWLPAGELGVLLQEPDGTYLGIQALSLDGERGPVLPVRGVPTGLGAWSPDGRYVVVWNYDAETPADVWTLAQLVDATTATVLRSLDGVRLEQAQWVDNERFLTWEPIITGEETTAEYRALVSLWTADGVLLERWIPPAEVVTLAPGPMGPLTIHLG